MTVYLGPTVLILLSLLLWRHGSGSVDAVAHKRILLAVLYQLAFGLSVVCRRSTLGRVIFGTGGKHQYCEYVDYFGGVYYDIFFMLKNSMYHTKGLGDLQIEVHG